MSAAHRPPPEPADLRVRALLDGTLTGSEAAVVREHLRSCDGCTALYDRLAELEHAALPGTGVLGPGARSRVLGWIDTPGMRNATPSASRRWILVASALGIAGVVFGIAGRVPEENEWAARGAPEGGRPVALRLFRLVRHGSTMQAEALSTSSPALARSDEIGFAYSNRGEYSHVTFLLASSDGAVSVLSDLSGPVQRGAADEPLDGTLALASAPAGSLRLYALFSVGPLSLGTLASESIRLPPSLPAVFPGHDPKAQASFPLRVEGPRDGGGSRRP